MKIETIVLSGLFEPVSPTNMLSNLTRHLDRSRFDVSEFGPWDRTFGDYLPNLDRVSGLLAEHIRQASGPIVIPAYSGGSHVVKRALLALDGRNRAKVVRTVLCADPSMPTGVPVTAGERIPGTKRILGTTRPGASGIAGAEPLWMPTGVDYVADAGDCICQTPAGSPLHTLSAVLTSLSPDAVKMTTNMRYQLAKASVGRRFDFAAYREAIDLFGAYAGRPSAHVTPYPPLLESLGKSINREVKA